MVAHLWNTFSECSRQTVNGLSHGKASCIQLCIIFLVCTHSVSSCFNHTIIPSQFVYINSHQNGES